MKIISKNHDYYDSALAFGHDPNVVFERKEETFNGYHGVKYLRKRNNDWPHEYDFLKPRLSTYVKNSNMVKIKGGRTAKMYPFTVAFCGKIYPGIRVEVLKDYISLETHFCYSFDDYRSTLTRFDIEFNVGNKSRWSIFSTSGSVLSENNCKEFFNKSGREYIEFFAEKRKPIVVWDTYGTIVVRNTYGNDGPYLYFNPELKQWEFFKVFDPYTAFQELDMFISGVMTHTASNPSKVKPKRPNPVDISDEDMRDKKGFDDMSFKKPPTKNR